MVVVVVVGVQRRATDTSLWGTEPGTNFTGG